MKKFGPQAKLDLLRSKYFISYSDPERSTEELLRQVKISVKSILESIGESPMYPINVGIPSISDLITRSVLPNLLSRDPADYLKKLNELVQGNVKSGDPYMVKNIIPTVSIPALSAYIASSVLMGNGVTGEDAGQTLHTEIACSSLISKLVGWDSLDSSGLFTFGGTGTNLYGVKMGLSKVDPSHNKKGITEPVVCIESTPSHYCHATAVDWLGIGTDNLIRVRSNSDQTTNIDDFKRACHKAIAEGKKIICINASAGTTSNMGIDDIKAIYDFREELIKEYKLTYTPHIHADAVLGWAYLVFNSYDFEQNPLSFTPNTLKKIKKILGRISTLKYADSFGVDFHKTGYVAYNSSMIMVKNRNDFKYLRRDGDIMTPLFHDDAAYNPGKYSLETSRSSANMLATWIALQTFGSEGYQLLLGHALEMGELYRREIEKNQDHGIYVANQDSFGPDVFVRCYLKSVNVKGQYESEMNNDESLAANTKYIKLFATWLEEKGVPFEKNGFAISRSSAAVYTNTGAPMVALRIYPLSPFIEEKNVIELVSRLIKLKNEFDSQFKKNE